MNVLRLARLRIALAALLLQSITALAAENGWQVSAGAGIIVRPEYPGSDNNKTHAFPFFNATQGRFTIGAMPGTGQLGVGIYLYRDGRWYVGAALAPDLVKLRKESDDDRLRGLGDIDRTVRAGLFAGYALGRFTGRASMFSDVGGEHQGTVATFDLEVRFAPTENLVLTAGPGLTWASNEHTKILFGIDAEQSARAGLPAFEAGGGIQSVRFAVGANYQLIRNWSLGTRVVTSKLRNDAAKSPITVDKKQNSFALFAVYRF